MSTRPNRLILAATLALILGIAGILAWRLTPKGDPILGPWEDSPPQDPFAQQYHFYADHRFTINGFSAPRAGTWKLLPGPYYASKHGHTLDQFPTDGYFPYISPAQFTPEEFKFILASGTYHLTPASAQVRIYRCQFTDSPGETFLVTLNAGELTSRHELGRSFKRPATWLDQAWQRLRDLYYYRFHP